MSEEDAEIYERNEEVIRRRDDTLRFAPEQSTVHEGLDEGPDGPCDSFVPDEHGRLTVNGKPACGRCGWSEDAHPLWGPEEGRW